MNPRILLSGAPVAIFYGLTTIGPAWLAVLGGFAASAVVFHVTRRDRLIGALTAFGFAVVAVSAVVGIAWSSEKAYLAAGPVSDFLFIPLYIGSIYIGKPLVGGIARELLPSVAGRISPNARLFVWLSLMWAAYDLVHGVARSFMLANLSVGEYIVWSRIVAWPPSGALLGLTALLIFRESRRMRSATLLSRAA